MAINSRSKLRDILEDPRAVAILEEYVPGFKDTPLMGPCMGMRMNILIKFEQAGFSQEAQEEIISRLDALDKNE